MYQLGKKVIAPLVAILLAACSATAPQEIKPQNNTVKTVKTGSVSEMQGMHPDNAGDKPAEVEKSDPLPKRSANLISEYKIGVDDVVQVSVWRNPNLSVTVPVRPDGMISIPLGGDILAGGLTPVQVAASIRKKLSQFVRAPQVTVILTQLNSHEYLSRVRVTGAVRNPISISYRQGMSILDVVLAAGGVTEFAASNRARLYRQVGKKTKSYRIRLGDILNRGKLKTNINLQPGDVITIPERLF